MNGRAIPGAHLFRLYVCDKEMSSHHITSLATKWHPNKAEMNRLCALVEDKCLNHFKNILKKKKRSSVNFGQIFDLFFSKETEASY